MRALDESFVVLPSSAASMYQLEPTSPASEGLGTHHSSGIGAGEGPVSVDPTNPTFNATFNANIHVLTHVFEIASSQTQVCNKSNTK
jgi:beclin 1